MDQNSQTQDVEIRIAFLEDQIDQLSDQVHRLQKDQGKLTAELQGLVQLVKPLLSHLSSIGDAEDTAPPPHY